MLIFLSTPTIKIDTAGLIHYRSQNHHKFSTKEERIMWASVPRWLYAEDSVAFLCLGACLTGACWHPHLHAIKTLRGYLTYCICRLQTSWISDCCTGKLTLSPICWLRDWFFFLTGLSTSMITLPRGCRPPEAKPLFSLTFICRFAEWGGSWMSACSWGSPTHLSTGQ